MNTKMYMVTVCEYTGCIRTNILNNSLFDTFEEGLKFGKDSIREYCYNIFYKNISDEELDLIPEELNQQELESVIEDFNNKDIRYEIIISIVSTNRKRFNTSKDLMNYFNTNIKNISNDELYDFLLSLVDSEDRVYDYNGNYITTFINEQCPMLEGCWSADIEFNEKDCKKGIYTFNYHIYEEEKDD